jgi:uncharacterized protein YcbX
LPGHVAAIAVAPVKGLALLHPETVDLTEAGVVENRRFHLIDERGRMVNGKRLGRLVQVRPAYDHATRSLSLAFPDGREVSGRVQLGEPVESWFYGRPRPGRLVEGPWAAALSAFAGQSLRLVEAVRPAASMDRGSRGAVSLLSSAAAEAQGLDPRRFRMLFTLGGVPAHAEDDWIGRDVRIGDAVVRPTGYTGRCLVTSQDPDSGRPDRDVLGLLREIRPVVDDTPLPFGVHGAVVRPGRVRLGDEVQEMSTTPFLR